MVAPGAAAGGTPERPHTQATRRAPPRTGTALAAALSSGTAEKAFDERKLDGRARPPTTTRAERPSVPPAAAAARSDPPSSHSEARNGQLTRRGAAARARARAAASSVESYALNSSLPSGTSCQQRSQEEKARWPARAVVNCAPNSASDAR